MAGLRAGLLVLSAYAAQSAEAVVHVDLEHQHLPAEAAMRLSTRLGPRSLRGGGSQGVMTKDYTIYTGTVLVGSERSPFDMLLDTGSSDVWVPASNCSSRGCRAKKKFDYATSKTYKETGRIFNATYLSGPVFGFWAQDDWTVSNMTVPSMPFGAVTSTVGLRVFENLYCDGVLGLNYRSLSTGGAPTLLDTMQTAGLISERTVGLYLTPPGSTGQLSLGGVDASKYTGDLKWAALTPANNTHWTVAMEGVKVKGNESLISTGPIALFDSGASYVMGPAEQVASLMSGIGAVARDREVYTLKACNATPPDIVFVINGTNFPLKASDYMWYNDANPNDCIVGFGGMYMSKGYEFWTLGIPFLSTYYGAFDADNRRVGLAPAVMPKPPTQRE